MINEYGALDEKRIGRERPKNSEKNCPSATLSITNPS
jgi:hypothetical protein